ncbi:hypothetical protein JZK55_12390 [Dissulfurispira thermophila]|uniref:Class I SAM-dependent methyltransferase n=2 Tax=root TaxID=1 RepID=A0A7G1H3L5_9BACT|nr:class I SAM-dependent methyltransferase [Dissulfurispira thermophila]BCB96317.1 hypothetical protein JZK55_12390 [Dissulfurispira thermophila]
MYDFYFGKREDIEKDPKRFLLAIKRMLPRWCNSIPDSEYLALYDVLDDLKLLDKSVLVETGSGASTIVLCYFALKTGGELYTWDINGSKLAYLRSIINDTLMRHFVDKNITNHWKYVAFSSISEFAGVGMLKEMGKKVNACFFDSEHTLDVLMAELKGVTEILANEAVVAIDDGNYFYKSYNTAYINMIRAKHNLPPINESPDNIGRHFWEEVSEYLKKNFKNVEYIKDTYKQTYQTDIFWTYYKTDREVMSGLDMEKTDDLDHRFDAWKVWR